LTPETEGRLPGTAALPDASPVLPGPAAPVRAVVKWILLASVIGTLTGAADAGFISLVHLAVAESNHYERIFYLLPAIFFVTALLSRFVFKNDLGADKLIGAIDYHKGRVEKGFLPTKVVNVFLILATGGSVGKESPCEELK
jgi:H+/Cl- antiporter ClcA